MAEICHNCTIELSGFSRVYRGGAILSRCTRCGYEQPTIPVIHTLSSLKAKYAGMWDVMKGSLTAIAPAVAACGIWDIAVAYETFKKVLENAMHQQARSLMNPAYGAAQAVLEVSKPTTVLASIRAYPNGMSYVGWQDGLAFFDFQNETYYRIAELEPWWTASEPKFPTLPAEQREEKTAAAFDSGKIADYIVAKVDELGGPVKAIDAGLLIPAHATGRVEADLAQPRQTQDFLPSEGMDESQLFVVGFDALLELMKQVIPAVVRHTIDTKDDAALRGIGQLVGAMRQFSAENRNASSRYPAEYDHTSSPHQYLQNPRETHNQE